MNKKIGTHKTTPNLSSETLFHLTSSFDILDSILKNGFQAKYIYEKLPGSKLAYFTKTVCFCDIPLSLIKEHVNWYGTYGIGISKPIAREEKGLSPVFYFHSKSSNFPRRSSEATSKWFQEFKFTHYLKQVRGKQMFLHDNNEPYYKWKTFYNEREWRYFPKNNKIKIVKYDEEIELENERQKLNKEELPNLKINPEWIEYIIIEDLNKLDSLMKTLEIDEYKGHYKKLMTKIITFNQIKNDF